MLYDLRRADVRIKWLVTDLLATLGLSYLFGAVMVALRAAVRADWSSTPFFTDATGALQSSNTKGVLELVYVF